MASSGNFAPQRNANEIVLYLSSTQPTPSMPFELQGSIAPDVWTTRVQTLTRMGARYSKPMFERIWLVLAILTPLFLPVGLYSIILSALQSKLGPGADDRNAFFEARSICSAMSIAIALVFVLPMVAWKFTGRLQANRQLKQWMAADSRMGSASMSAWRVKTPGVFRPSTLLTIRLPGNASPTSFHPNAYLPSYINGPSDADAAYYYPYKAEPGLPKMSVVGNVPLYTDEKRGFEDLKV